MGEGAIMTRIEDIDITLTESFWREACPKDTDAEIAERLALRRVQVAEHAARCAREAAQDIANLQARADYTDGNDCDDEDQDDTDYQTGKDANMNIDQYTQIVTGAAPAAVGILPSMLSRTVTSVIDEEVCDRNIASAYAQLSPVSFPVLQTELKLLQAQGCTLEHVEKSLMPCSACGYETGIATTYVKHRKDGSRDWGSCRVFHICGFCFHAVENIVIEHEAVEGQTAKEAVQAHAEGIFTEGWIAPVPSDTSSMGQTAPQPNQSNAAHEL
jgi:hypothetical protein